MSFFNRPRVRFALTQATRLAVLLAFIALLPESLQRWACLCSTLVLVCFGLTYLLTAIGLSLNAAVLISITAQVVCGFPTFTTFRRESLLVDLVEKLIVFAILWWVFRPLTRGLSTRRCSLRDA